MSRTSKFRKDKIKKFPDYTGDKGETASDNTYILPDVGEEATINYNGKEVTINVNMLNDIRKLGFGNYGSVMLAEVQNQPEIKMAVKLKNANVRMFGVDIRKINLIEYELK
ncbi:unnamed protein product [Rotaria sp. Silwood1]|nr:unnamed protein product [Rotaria sp. Silwood1]